MRKKQKAFAILSCVLVLLCAAAITLGLYTPGASVQPEDTAVSVIHDIHVSRVKAVAVTNNDATFGIMAAGDGLVMVSDVPGSYNVSELQAFLYAASHLTGSRENKDLNAALEYGLESPLARVTIILEDGAEVNFALLQRNPIDGSYYLFSEDNQATYLVPAAQAELFLRREQDFFQRTVLPVVNGSNYRGVERVAMDFGGNGRDYTLAQQEDGFYMTFPITQRLSTPVVMEELLRYLSALYADEFIESGADLSAYGFDGYDLKVTMNFEGEMYTVLLLEQEGGRLLMANPADGTVYGLETPNLPLLQRDYLTLTRGVAYTYTAGDLRSVAVSDATREVLFEVSGSGEDMTAQVGSQALDGPTFAQLVGDLNTAPIEREVSGVGPQDGPVLTLRFTLSSGSIEGVEFLPDGTGSYYVSVNGVINFTTTGAAVDAIAEAAFRYL